MIQWKITNILVQWKRNDIFIQKKLLTFSSKKNNSHFHPTKNYWHLHPIMITYWYFCLIYSSWSRWQSFLWQIYFYIPSRLFYFYFFFYFFKTFLIAFIVFFFSYLFPFYRNSAQVYHDTICPYFSRVLDWT